MKPSIFSEPDLTLIYFLFSGNNLNATFFNLRLCPIQCQTLSLKQGFK